MIISKAPINPLIQNVEGMHYGEQVRDYYHQYYMKEFVKWLKEPCMEEHWFSFADGKYHQWPSKNISHRECPKCWKVLLKEGEDNGTANKRAD